MTRKYQAPLAIAALAWGWTAGFVVAPATAADHDSQFAAINPITNQGPQAGTGFYVFGATGQRTDGVGARGASAVPPAPAVSRGFANQGAHGFGDPYATGDVSIAQPAPSNFVNQGGHAMGDPMASGRLPPSAAPDHPINQGAHPLG